MGKARSPNYPAMSLSDAITKVKAVYSKDYRNKMSREVVAKHLGYNSINGASLTAISGLIKYGLLDGRGDGVQVTDDAVMILVEPDASKERLEALRRAALRPALFAQLHKQYGDNAPSIENLNAYLQRNGFNPSAAAAAGRAYRDTFSFVTSQAAAYNAPMEKQGHQEVLADRNPVRDPDEFDESVRHRVSKDCIAEVFFHGQPTQEAIDKLVQYLYLMKDTLPTEKTPA